jgi:hypothetical protein
MDQFLDSSIRLAVEVVTILERRQLVLEPGQFVASDASGCFCMHRGQELAAQAPCHHASPPQNQARSRCLIRARRLTVGAAHRRHHGFGGGGHGAQHSSRRHRVGSSQHGSPALTVVPSAIS